jgi:hypothetical protein
MKYLAIVAIVLSSTMPCLAQSQSDTSGGSSANTQQQGTSRSTAGGGGSGARLIVPAFRPSHARMNTQDTQSGIICDPIGGLVPDLLPEPRC